MNRSLGDLVSGARGGLVEQAIGAIYRDPTGAGWPEALDSIARSHDAAWAHIHIDNNADDFDAPRISVPNAAADPGILSRQTAGGFSQLDPRRALLIKNEGKITACWQIIDPQAFDHTRYVREFLDAPENDLRWSMAGGKILDSGSRTLFGVARPRRSGPFDTDHVGQFAALAVHILAAVELHETLRQAERSARLLAQIGESDHVALVCVDRLGRLAFADIGGETALRQARHIFVKNGEVCFANSRAQAALAAAIASKADVPAFRIVESGLQIKVQALPDVAGARAGALPPIAVLIEMRERSSESLIASLIATLTAREREVCELLANGMTPAEMSETLQKSVDTVRTQIKAAMRKLKVHRQSQVVRAILAEREK